MEPFNREDYRALKKEMTRLCDDRGIDNDQLLTWIVNDEFGGVEKSLREIFERLAAKGVDPRTMTEDIANYQLFLMLSAMVNSLS
jgi:hypothetical protein